MSRLHIFMGAGKYDNKHGVGIMLNKRWRKRIIDTEYMEITTTKPSTHQIDAVCTSRTRIADHHIEKTMEKHIK